MTSLILFIVVSVYTLVRMCSKYERHVRCGCGTSLCMCTSGCEWLSRGKQLVYGCTRMRMDTHSSGLCVLSFAFAGLNISESLGFFCKSVLYKKCIMITLG